MANKSAKNENAFHVKAEHWLFMFKTWGSRGTMERCTCQEEVRSVQDPRVRPGQRMAAMASDFSTPMSSSLLPDRPSHEGGRVVGRLYKQYPTGDPDMSYKVL